jgi:integrase
VSRDVEVVKISERVRLDKRERSPKWQARVKLANGTWHRFSTKTEDLEKAKEAALKFYYAADDRLKNNLPQNTRRFKAVAQFARDRMEQELASGGGRIVFKDYITAIDKYLIPFFGQWDVASIDVAALKKFDTWRTEKLERPAAHSTINTHNSALNRVLDEAELRGWITQAIRPTLLNKGKPTQSRGTFTTVEYQKIYVTLRKWDQKTYHPKARLTREVLRNYVLFLANTGIRHGTEAMNLKWKNVQWVELDGQRYLAIYPNGKTGPREAIARDRVLNYLDRQRALNPRLRKMTLAQVIDAKLDEWVFCNREGEKESAPDIARNFETLLDHLNLKHGPDGKPRTLYSFRHFYATLDLQRGVSTHLLSRQLGNSTAMLDRFYSKLAPRMNADTLSGRKGNGRAKRATAAAVKAEVIVPSTAPGQIAAAPVALSAGNAAAMKAFDLLDAGKLSEAGLLAALGVLRRTHRPRSARQSPSRAARHRS